VRASARIVAKALPDGGTRLTTLAGEAPLLLRRTGPQRAGALPPGLPQDSALPAGPAQVHLVGGAAGPLGGDELRCTVELGPAARVDVRSVAASIALPGPHGRESTLDILVRIEAGAALSWTPQPLIAARGARHRTTVRIELAEDARLVWREETLLGRDGEDPGPVSTRLRVCRAGRVLIDHAFAVGPRHPGSLGPAVTGGHRAAGTVLIVDPAWVHVAPADRIKADPQDAAAGAVAVQPLSGPAVLVSALATDGLTLRRLLDPCLSAHTAYL
jgi:urease accessory protein